MLMRKINAGVSLLTTVFAFGHAISLAVWMLTRGAVPMPGAFIPWALTVLTLMHVFISIDFLVSHHMEKKTHKGRMYPRMNIPMIVQRLSGALMLVFTGLHIAGATGLMQPSQVVHAIVPPLFFAVVMVHVAVSTSKAFITLGIGSARFVKRADIAIKLLCALTLLADIIGFYLHVC